MPIYEYRCERCGHDLEVLQKLTDPVLTACPQCQTDSLVKRVSAAGFQLKGSGWYATDFRNGGSKPAASAAKSDGKADAASAPSDGNSEGNSDAKPSSAAAPSAGCGGGCACH